MASPVAPLLDFLDGGACGQLIRDFDWASTPLGPIAEWPESLRSMVASMLHTRQPMLLFWGPALIQLYNDSFVPSFGRGKHPAAMGQRAPECWADAWPVVETQIEGVMSRGEPAWSEDALVPIFRNGRLEEVFWTYGYSPAYQDGKINVTLVIVTEVTGHVLAVRRLEALAALGVELSVATTYDDVMAALCVMAHRAASDISFFVMRARDGATARGREVGIDATRAEEVTAGVLEALAGEVSRELREVALDVQVTGRVWPEPVTRAVACAVGARPHVLVFGVSPRLPLDERYQSFLAQVVEQAASTLRRIDTANASRAIERQRDNLLMHAPIATALLTGPEHVFQLANPYFRKIVGRDPAGKSLREAFPELRGGPVPAIFDRVFRTAEPYVATELLVPLVRGEGGAPEDGYFNFNLEPLRDEEGVVYGMMAVVVEITAQVHARRSLEKIGEERGRVLAALEDANRTKDDFLAMLGHELRNPLAPIVTALALMNEKDTNAAAERAVIERQLRHVIRLVDDLLDISRITRGLLTLEPTTVELADVLDTAAQANAPLIGQRGHTLHVEAPRGIFVHGDEARLLQIVSNLVTNAARYTPNGGQIRVALAAEAGDAVVRVADNGAGIEPHLLAKMFDMFVQGPRSPDRAEGGLGLGLAIVKNLVELHGGSVSAESDGPGKGSTFTVKLPRAETRPSPAMPAMPAPGPAARVTAPKRVLIVDDNEDAAELLAEIARMEGHDVTTVHEPVRAIALARELSPQIAILDIGLPGMDGYQLGAHLREACPACQIIALTGYGQDKDRQRSADAGFAAHLVKPVKVDLLLEMLAI
jgi:signal transduction histidine kinase